MLSTHHADSPSSVRKFYQQEAYHTGKNLPGPRWNIRQDGKGATLEPAYPTPYSLTYKAQPSMASSKLQASPLVSKYGRVQTSMAPSINSYPGGGDHASRQQGEHSQYLQVSLHIRILLFKLANDA